MSDEFVSDTSIETTEVASDDAGNQDVEVENTDSEKTVSDVDNMDEKEFAEFEEKAFNKESDSDDDSDGDVATEPTTEELDELYKSQMASPDAKLDKPIVIKVAGKVYKVDSVAELKNLAELGTSSTQKFQAIAKHRRTLDYMEDNDIRQEDLDQLVQSRGEAPVLRDANVNATEDVAQSILDSDIADEFTRLASELPDDVKQMMSTNPNMMSGFAHDVRSGVAGAIASSVARYMNVNGMNHMQAYSRARDEFVSQNQGSQKPQQQQKPSPQQMLKNQPKPRGSVKAPSLSREDIDKMSEEDFNRFYETV